MFAGLASPTHLLLLLLIIILLFGAKRLPEMGRSLGRGLHELKEGIGTKEQPEEESDQKHTEAIEEKKLRRKKHSDGTEEEKNNVSIDPSDLIGPIISRSPQGRGLMWLWRKL